jgi:transcriptional regulator with XRE-family HTH domain
MRENPGKVRLRIGRNIRQLRLLHGWSQEQLAERVDITEKHIGQLERGKVNVGVDRLTSVANELAVDVAELLRTPNDTGGMTTYVITRQDLERIEEALRAIARVKRSRARRSRSD